MPLLDDPLPNPALLISRPPHHWRDRLTLAQAFELSLDLSPLNCASRLHGLARSNRSIWSPARRAFVDQTGAEHYAFAVCFERRNRGRNVRTAPIVGVISRDASQPKTHVSGKGTVQEAYLLYISALVAAGLALLSHPAYVFALVVCIGTLPFVATAYLDNRRLIADIKRELTAQVL